MGLLDTAIRRLPKVCNRSAGGGEEQGDAEEDHEASSLVPFDAPGALPRPNGSEAASAQAQESGWEVSVAAFILERSLVLSDLFCLDLAPIFKALSE